VILPWWALTAVLSAWSVGILLAVLHGPPPFPLAGALLVAVLLLALRWSALSLPVGLSAFALALGLGRGALHAEPSLPPGLLGESVAVSAVVDDDPVVRRGSTRLILRTDRVQRGDATVPIRTRLLTSVYAVAVPSFGDRVVVTGRLAEAPSFEQFDYHGYLAGQGITGIVEGPRLVRVDRGRGDPLHGLLFFARRRLVGTVERVLPEPQSALVMGVVYGYRTALPATLEQQMIASGLIPTKLVQTNVRFQVAPSQPSSARLPRQ